MMRRLLFAAGLALSVVSAQAAAQAVYPAKPVSVVVPFPPGGVVDILGRLLADKMGTLLGGRMIVENRPGAGGTIGAAAVAKAAPDGYTILVGGAATHVFSPLIYPSVPYDPLKSFAPIGQATSGPLVLVVPQNSSVRSFADFRDYVQREGDKLSYASNGAGTFPHLAAELYRMQTGARFVHVPYSGGAQAMVAVTTGEVGFSINHIPNVVALVKSGSVRAIATTGKARSSSFPALPTFAESGMADFETSAWFGLFAPAGTPAGIVDRLREAMVKALQAPELGSKLASQGDEPVGSSPRELAAYVEAEIRKWSPVMKAAGIKVQ